MARAACEQAAQERGRIEAKARLRVVDRITGRPRNPEIGDAIGDRARAWHRAALAAPRPNDDLVGVRAPRRGESKYILGPMLSVAVERDDRRGVARESKRHSLPQTGAFAPIGDVVDDRYVEAGQRGAGIVARTIVNDDHVPG